MTRIIAIRTLFESISRILSVSLLLLSAILFLTACTFGRASEQAAAPVLDSYEPADDSQSNASQPAATDAESTSDASVPIPMDPPALFGRYTAEVVPVDQVPVIPEVAGQVLQFDLEVGDSVSNGDVILTVDSSTYEAQRAQALAALQAAQAQLDLLVEGADERDIEAARAAVTAADEGYKRALEGPTEDDLTMAEAQLRQAEAAVKQAQAAYDQVSWNPLIAALPESMQLEAATLNLEAAQAQYDKITKGATEDVIAGAYAQLAGARAQLQALEEGAKPAQIDAAKAQVSQAETALYLTQLQLDKTQLRAPIDGIVASVSTGLGSMVGPGNPVVILMSPEVKIVVPVEETRLSSLAVGQPATIRVDAYPDREFAGEIAIIAPTINPATRTVQVTVRPLDGEGVLMPGMYATVELQHP